MCQHWHTARTVATRRAARAMQKANEITTRRVQAAMPQLIQRLQAAMQEGGAPTPDASQASKP